MRQKTKTKINSMPYQEGFDFTLWYSKPKNKNV